MKKSVFYRTITIVMSCTLLFSCDKDRDGKKEVEQLVKTIETASQVKPQNEFEKKQLIQTYTYQGGKERDPFEEPLTMRTDKQYKNTILKNVALDSLKLVGIVIHDHFRWGVFRANDGKLYKFGVGTRVGIENAVLTQIDAHQVKFVQEIDISATEISTRNIVMQLQEPKS